MMTVSQRKTQILQRHAIQLLESAQKSPIKHRHAAVALINNKIISPVFYNHYRERILGSRGGTAHSEMCVLNYLLASSGKLRPWVLHGKGSYTRA